MCCPKIGESSHNINRGGMSEFEHKENAKLKPSLSPEQLAELKELANENTDRLLRSIGEENADKEPWKFSMSNDELNLKVYTSNVPGNSLMMFKAEARFSGLTPEKVFGFLMDHEKRLSWDRGLCVLESTLVEKNTEDDKLIILKCGTNRVGPISGREFVDVCAHRILKQDCASSHNVYMSAGSTISADWINKIVPPNKDFIRGANFAGSGWHVTAEDGEDGSVTTVVTYIIHTDLKGWFLPMVINQAISGSYVDFFKGVKEEMPRYLRKKEEEEKQKEK